MLQTNTHKIQRAFSQSAEQYDRHSHLHREIADALLVRIPQGCEPLRLLDVGCGTGYLTLKAKERFSQSKIVGLDFAPGMIQAAAPRHVGISWVLADGSHLPFSDESFNLLISNLAYQWAGDLSQAFIQARRVLVPDGIFACTLFGHDTCQELFQSLHEARAGALQFKRLPKEADIRQALDLSGFSNPQVDTEQMRVEFGSMHELIGWLKSIGANHLSRDGYLGREALSLAASIYQEKFPYRQGVGATFEVIRVYAKK